VGVGIALGDNWVRAKVVNFLKAISPSLVFPNLIHPSAQVGLNVTLGVGNALMAGTVINSNTKLGNFCICNSNCSIDHDNTLGDFVSFAPNSCSGGNVEVGDYSFIGLGANIIHGVTIGSHSVIGSGATVLKSVPAEVVAYGSPCRTVRSRNPDDKYL
jgi:sugar O-acyltransferase (sialic acid O-acetyltransferase NeuD family)